MSEKINPSSNMSGSSPETHRFAHKAMATSFEIFISHPDGCYAEQAAWAAFDELDRLEQELSRYVEDSDIARISTLAANQPLQVGLSVFECLHLCTRISAETNGSFDITIGRLSDFWLEKRGARRPFSEKDLNLARQCTGMHLIELDETRHTMQLSASPVQIDLGGVGKGYAVDRMAALLRDWSIDAALIHGGRSSVLALTAPPLKKGWPVRLPDPNDRTHILATLWLRNRAVSGSGRRRGPHVIDPRSGRPVENKSAAWCCAPSAAVADALSTAFLVMTPDEISQYCAAHSGVLAMIVMEEKSIEPQKARVLRYGPWEDYDLLRE